MPPRFCCCLECDLLDDNFNRPDGDPGPNWEGDGVIVSQVLHADMDKVKVCHPAAAPLGSLYGYCTLKDCDPSREYRVRLGDPTGDYDVVCTFTGSVGSGTFRITVEGGVGGSVFHDYDWENEDEFLQICYEPGVQLSAGTSSRTSGLHPDWVTVCIPLDPHDNCWPGGYGNWMFVEGRFDNFHFEVHWIELKTCEDCDCKCWYIDENGDYQISCIPSTLCLTITSEDCPGFANGTYNLVQRLMVDGSPPLDAYPTVTAWPQKFTWITDEIECPFDGFKFYFRLICGYNSEDDTRPKFRLQLVRFDPGSTMFTTFEFDPSSPNSSSPGPYSNEAFSLVELTSTCDPFYLEFPTIIEDSWQSSDPDDSCCGGSIFSDPEATPAVPSHFTVIITECS